MSTDATASGQSESFILPPEVLLASGIYLTGARRVFSTGSKVKSFTGGGWNSSQVQRNHQNLHPVQHSRNPCSSWVLTRSRGRESWTPARSVQGQTRTSRQPHG